MNTRNTTARIAALLAAVSTTALVIGGQLGIAGHYTVAADALMAAQRAAPLAQNAASPAPQRQPI